MNAIRGCLAFVLVLGSSAAAETHPPQLEEIIVSARRVDERLQDVPISVTVLGGVQLENFAVTRWEDLTLPGVKIGPAGLMDVLSIRGIASGINFGFEQSAPVFIDGVWFGSSRSSRIGFLDTERVEILKGPQPTHFGKNAIAGAFGIVTRKPQPEHDAGLEVYHEFEHEETAVTGMVNFPLTDRLAARVAGRWRDLGGYMTSSVDGRSSPQQQDQLARLSLRWQPDDALTVDGKIEYSNNETIGRETQYVRCVPRAFTIPRLLNPEFEDCRMDTVRSLRFDRSAFGEAMTLFRNPNRPGERIDNELLSSLVAVDWQLAGGHTIGIDVAYYDQDFLAEVKQDHAWNQRSLAAYDDSSRLFSQEVRIVSPQDARWFWMAGAYHEEVARDNAPFSQLALQAPASQGRITRWHEDSDAWAVFAELGLQVVDDVTLKAGGRYTEASRDVDAEVTVYQIAPDLTAPGADPWSFAVPTSVTQTSFFESQDSRQDDKFTPAVTVEWRPRDTQMVYLSWREGFKAGGFSSFFDTPADAIGFDPETVDYWEAGLKAQSASGAWRFSTAVFDGDYDDLQLAVLDPATGDSQTRNAGGATTRGVDLEVTWLLAEDWQLGAAVYYLDAEYTQFRDASCYLTPVQTIALGCVRTGGAPLPPDATLCLGNPGVTCAQDLSGFPTSFAPEWSGNLSLQYRRPFDPGGSATPLEFSAGVDLMVTDAYYTSVNGAPGSRQPSFAKLDARVAVAEPGGRWEVALVGRNLTDEIYGVWYEPLVGAGPNTGWFTTTARTRQIGLQLRLGF